MEGDHSNQDHGNNSTNAEDTVGHSTGGSSNNNDGIHFSLQPATEPPADDASSAWETESDSSMDPNNFPNIGYISYNPYDHSDESFGDGVYDEDLDEIYDEDYDEDYDEEYDEDFDNGFDELFGAPNFFTNLDSVFNIERLTPQVRANRRATRVVDDPEDDIMSEFSGDEKYEPKDFELGEVDGQGSADMHDFDPLESVESESNTTTNLTELIRQLMIKLSQGRRTRERKLGVQSRRESKMGTFPDTASEPQARSMVEPTKTEEAKQESLPKSEHYLHKLMVRGRDYPQEVVYSPAISFHFQCANSLVITPSAMAVHDDIYTIHHRAIHRCGIPDPAAQNFTDYDRYVNSRIGNSHLRTTKHQIHTRKSGLVTTFKATKYLKSSVHRFDHIMPSDNYITMENYEDPLCFAHRFGYLVHGTYQNYLMVYCTDCEGEPKQIHYDELVAGPRRIMINSIQIVRWPRYGKYKAHKDETKADSGSNNSASSSAVGADLDTDMMDAMEEDDLDPEELKDGFSSPNGQFDHYMVVTGNEKGLFVVSLPDHVHSAQTDDEHAEHEFKFRTERHTWIRTGFHGQALNDAKVSPNGRYIAIVGDAQRVWTIEVRHVPETEEQRRERKKREHEIMVNELETDSEYATEDSMEDESDDPKDSNMATDGQGRGKRQRGSLDADREKLKTETIMEDGSTGGAAPRSKPRLLHQFGEPQEHLIPDQVLYPPPTTKNGRRPFDRSKYTSQYVSWNASSTKFAHSSDTCTRVVVWSMPAREIVCCVDVGGFSFSIDFHPSLENLFACANWYGFVHVVDISGCCIGDVDLVPTDTRYDGKAVLEPGLKGCAGPHYEEKHDILMLSFRGQLDESLRILDSIRGLGWSTDGRHLYVSTLRRVLKYALAHEQVRVPSLFELCALKIRDWKEQQWIKSPFPGFEHPAQVANKGKSTRGAGKETPIKRKRFLSKASDPIAKAWPYVPVDTKRQIWGNMYHLRSHNE